MTVLLFCCALFLLDRQCWIKESSSSSRKGRYCPAPPPLTHPFCSADVQLRPELAVFRKNRTSGLFEHRARRKYQDDGSGCRGEEGVGRGEGGEGRGVCARGDSEGCYVGFLLSFWHPMSVMGVKCVQGRRKTVLRRETSTGQGQACITGSPLFTVGPPVDQDPCTCPLSVATKCLCCVVLPPSLCRPQMMDTCSGPWSH